MNVQVIPDIPRLYTTIAECIACLIYILPLKKRMKGMRLYLFLMIAAVILWGVHNISGQLPITFWIPGMLTAMGLMYLYIYMSCDISLLDAGYFFTRAFIAAELAASLGWQIYYYFFHQGKDEIWWLSGMVMFLVYGVVFVIIYLIDARKLPGNIHLGVNPRELSSSILVAFATFLISNINFVVENSVFGSSVGINILYIRTLVNFSGLTMLFAQQEQRREMYLGHELEAMNNVLHRQYEQYQQSKESVDLINRKYHDLKHQIATIRTESDPEKRESYLADIDHALSIHEAQNKTGNTVLDTVLTGKSLYCTEHDINLTCVVDGSLLDFMPVMDICTIFGNALDNAIESVEKLRETEKRIIRVAVYSQNDLLMLRFENYFEESLLFEDGLPTTTKKTTSYHGYGLKSIKLTAEKYGGNITINTEDNWFYIRILIPMS